MTNLWARGTVQKRTHGGFGLDIFGHDEFVERDELGAFGEQPVEAAEIDERCNLDEL